jgi:hypothetical protein
VIDWALPREEFHTYLRALVEGIESASFLTPEQKRDIFYNTAARFLRLSPEEIARHHEMIRE